ncbi:membrane protein [Bacillus manliponensis]|uniref:Membrane protein n=1 Tax=Bacillus manliponensis TaxID=574376 RepID=A0A073K2C8_9BACI|nr:DUF975 family protein [Bacillus manliponensis]KEK21439.1 membrane protein [Bacillus manliponensis]
MISEMKREALQSLKGKWGLGVGGTLLYFIVSYAVSMLASLVVMIPGMMIFFLTAGLVGAFEGEEMTAIGLLVFVILYVILLVVTLASYGVTVYGYTNVFLQLSRTQDVTIDALFEGFRGFKKMMKTMKAMILICVYTGTWLPLALFGVFVALIEGDGSSTNDEFLILICFTAIILSIIGIIVMYFSYALTFHVMIDYPEYGVLEAMKESKRLMKGRKMDLFMLWISFIGWWLLAIVTLGIGLLWVSPYMMTTTAVFYNKISNHNKTEQEL